MKESFPQRLKSLRLRRRVSASVLGGLCGLSRNSVGRYEAGKIQPTMTSLIALADYFDVSIDYLLGRV